jgi:hypothetical protein
MTARVHSLLQQLHEETHKPDLGLVFPRDETGKDPVPYDRVKFSARRDNARIARNEKVSPVRPSPHVANSAPARLGADAFSIQKIAAHSTITVSQRYVHPTPERVEDAFHG